MNVLKKDPITKAKEARTKLLMGQPFWGYLACKLVLVEDERMASETNATDGDRIYLNPNHWKKINPRQAVFEIAHEVGHCILRHHERIRMLGRKGDRRLWNTAGDYAINLMLQKSGFDVPKDALLDQQYQGMITEQIYDKIKGEESGNRKKFSKCMIYAPKGGGGGDQKGKDESKGEAGGQKGKPQKKRPLKIEDIKKPPKNNWNTNVQEAVEFAKMKGELPAGIEQFVEAMLAPKVDWRQILYQFMCHARKDDYSFRRPNRRYAHMGIYLPILHSESVDVVVAIDTSGSVSDALLRRFFSEVASIAQQLQIKVRGLQCDARISGEFEIKGPEDVQKIKVKGRGGTSFKPVFNYVEKKQWRPECLIYFTDLMGDFPKPPNYETMWAVPSMQPWMKQEGMPPFGKILVVDED